MMSTGRRFRVTCTAILAIALACGCSKGGGGGAQSDAAVPPGADSAPVFSDVGGQADASDATGPGAPDLGSAPDLSDAASAARDTVAPDAGAAFFCHPGPSYGAL